MTYNVIDNADYTACWKQCIFGFVRYTFFRNPEYILQYGNAQFFVWRGTSFFCKGGGLFGPAPLLFSLGLRGDVRAAKPPTPSALAPRLATLATAVGFREGFGVGSKSSARL